MNDYVNGLIGGSLLGVAAVFLKVTVGSPLGISGFLSKALSFRASVAGWRLSFLLGMALAAVALRWLHPPALAEVPMADAWLLGTAGLLVGGGARVAGGCTSGHSLCGMGNLDIDSVLATVIFIVSGAAAVYVTSGGSWV